MDDRLKILLAMFGDFGEALNDILNADGYDATCWSTVGSADSIIRSACSGRYDLLVLSNTVCSPFDIAKALAEPRPSCPEMKVLIISGFISEPLMKAWKDAGADAIMKMPFLIATFRSTVQSLLPPTP